mgnify:CR=1 FL=1
MGVYQIWVQKCLHVICSVIVNLCFPKMGTLTDEGLWKCYYLEFIGVIYCECKGTISVDDCLHIDFTKILELA